MPRPDCPTPWIEKLILDYREDAGFGEQVFKAHVVCVGRLSYSQMHQAPGYTDLLYVSDGEVHIAALLTPEAVQQLQDTEERESLSGLHYATVNIQKVQLMFLAHTEETRSRFYLVVGAVTTMYVNDSLTPVRCCSLLPSVHKKISTLWKGTCLDNLPSQVSQSMSDLSELLWEFEQDFLQTLRRQLEDTLLGGTKTTSASQQPCTSTKVPSDSRPQNKTRWDMDRIRFKNSPCFSVPGKLLLMPEDRRIEDETREPAENHKVPQTSTNPKGTETHLSQEAATHPDPRPTTSVDEDHRLQETSHLGWVLPQVLIGSASGWDHFPPPCETSSSSDASGNDSPEPTPLTPELAPELLPLSDFPPYQNPRSSSAETRSSVLESSEEEKSEGRRKRKRSHSADEDQANTSPPSWIAATQDRPIAEDGLQPSPPIRPVQVTQQDIDDFSRFSVSETLSRWAVQYLLHKQI